MIKKEIFIGFMVGLIANAIGLIIAIFIFGNVKDLYTSVQHSIDQDFFGKLVSIGAILNLVVFFLFLRRKRDYRARGVILATIFIAIATFLVSFI